MRRYEHQPDEAWIEQQFARKRRLLETVERTVERSGREAGRLSVFDTAIVTAVDAVSLGWAMGEPVAALRPWLSQASAWTGEALERGRVLDGGLAERWLAVALLAGNWELAERIARFVPDQVEGWAQREPLAREYVVALSRLTRGDQRGAAAAATAMAEAADAINASPVAIEYYDGLAPLASAVAETDQVAFDRGVRARTDAVVRHHGRSVEGRRDSLALLDLRAAALAALAYRSGLRLPPDNAYLGTELIQAAG